MKKNVKLIIDVDDDFINSIVDSVIERIEAKKIDEATEKEELEFYTIKQIVFITQKSNLTIRNHIHAGLLKGNKVGKSFLISKDDLQSYLKNQK